LFGRFVFCVGFFFAATGTTPVKINRATIANRCAAFTQMHRATQQLWLCCAANLVQRYDCNSVSAFELDRDYN